MRDYLTAAGGNFAFPPFLFFHGVIVMKRFFSFLFALVGLLSVAAPAFASPTLPPSSEVGNLPSVDDENVTFWDWMTDDAVEVGVNGVFGELVAEGFKRLYSEVACNHEHIHFDFNYGGQSYFTCDDCGQTIVYDRPSGGSGGSGGKFYGAGGHGGKIPSDELDNYDSVNLDDLYNNYVSSLPAGGIDYAGRLIWYPTWDDVSKVTVYYADSSYIIYGSNAAELSSYTSSVNTISLSGRSAIVERNTKTLSSLIAFGNLGLLAPVSGIYYRLATAASSGSYQSSGNLIPFYRSYLASSLSGSKTAGSSFTDLIPPFWKYLDDTTTYNYTYMISNCTLPVYRIVPTSGLVDMSSDVTYNINTRFGPISGNFGVISDNDTNIVRNISIVNETNNTYYDFTTNEYQTINNWNYDYSDRSYNLTLDNGDTVTVTYGDEYVTINNDNSTYNVYYYIEVPSAVHYHDYVLTDTVAPSCTVNGYYLYTCAGCGDSYTQIIFATGHNWQYVETAEAVEAVVDDDTGEVISDAVDGYDLYRCFYCGEEKRVPIGESIVDDSSNNSSFFSWLQKWLTEFGAWTREKFDTIINYLSQLVGGASEPDDKTITYEDENGEEQSFSVDNILARFGWWREVWKIGEDFINQVSANESAAYSSGGASLLAAGNPSGAPSISLDLSAAQSVYGFDYGGEVQALDLSWYTPYKQDVDRLISGFMWLFFLWSVYRHAPGIISGVGLMANRLDDISNNQKGGRSK